MCIRDRGVVAPSHLKSTSDKSSDAQTLLDLSSPSEESLPPVTSVLSKQMSNLGTCMFNFFSLPHITVVFTHTHTCARAVHSIHIVTPQNVT